MYLRQTCHSSVYSKQVDAVVEKREMSEWTKVPGTFYCTTGVSCENKIRERSTLQAADIGIKYESTTREIETFICSSSVVVVVVLVISTTKFFDATE